jgi:hypothetical protein
MSPKTNKQKDLIKHLKIITFFPLGAGTFTAILIFLSQYWKWLQSGEWPGAPLAHFMPRELLTWAAEKQEGLLTLKKTVLGLLSLHASVWFFVTGCVCTIVLYEITKPWLKD